MAPRRSPPSNIVQRDPSVPTTTSRSKSGRWVKSKAWRGVTSIASSKRV
jgi:hypothetical protein